MPVLSWSAHHARVQRIERILNRDYCHSLLLLLSSRHPPPPRSRTSDHHKILLPAMPAHHPQKNACHATRQINHLHISPSQYEKRPHFMRSFFCIYLYKFVYLKNTSHDVPKTNAYHDPTHPEWYEMQKIGNHKTQAIKPPSPHSPHACRMEVQKIPLSYGERGIGMRSYLHLLFHSSTFFFA